MSWNTITAADVTNDLTPVEVATLQGLQESTANLDNILTNVVNAARGAIVAGGNQLDQPGTVPDQLRADVIAIARWKWLISLPDLGEGFQSKTRKDAHDDAQKRLDGVSMGKPKIELPDNPLTSVKAPVNAVTQVRRGRRICTDSFDKLGST